MNEKRGQWGSRMGFIIAAIGSAIGLGNIWRFPYVAASNGGGAFLIPYLFALLTAGIPILILEFSIAHKIKRSAPGIFGRISKKLNFLAGFKLPYPLESSSIIPQLLDGRLTMYSMQLRVRGDRIQKLSFLTIF